MVQYKVMSIEDAAKAGVPEAKSEADVDPNVFGWCAVRVDDDGTHTWLGHDLCEPEDRLLVRHFKWVPLALNDAFALGKSVHDPAIAELRKRVDALEHVGPLNRIAKACEAFAKTEAGIAAYIIQRDAKLERERHTALLDAFVAGYMATDEAQNGALNTSSEHPTSEEHARFLFGEWQAGRPHWRPSGPTEAVGDAMEAIDNPPEDNADETGARG